MIEIEITYEDRLRFPHYTDSAIRGVKLIESQPNAVLQRAIVGSEALESLRLQVGKDTNPNWVIACAANVLYERGQIDEKELDWITR